MIRMSVCQYSYWLFCYHDIHIYIYMCPKRLQGNKQDMFGHSFLFFSQIHGVAVEISYINGKYIKYNHISYSLNNKYGDKWV